VNSALVTFESPDGAFSIGFDEASQPIVRGLVPGTHTVTVQPQRDWQNVGNPLVLTVLSANMVMSATPAVIRAGQSTTIAAELAPEDTHARGQFRWYPFAPQSITSGTSRTPFLTQTFADAGVYRPRVEAEVPSEDGSPWPVAATAETLVVVRYADPVVQASLFEPKVGEEVEFTLIGADYLGPQDEIIWTWQGREFNSAQAYRQGSQNSPNVMRWTFSETGRVDVAVRLERDGFELASASNWITVQPRPQQPAPTMSVGAPATVSVNQSFGLAITATNVLDNEYAVIMNIPEYGEYNPVADPTVTKTRNGNVVTMVVPLTFSNAGAKQITARLDAVVNGSWQQAIGGVKTLTVTANASGGGDPDPELPVPSVKIVPSSQTRINEDVTLFVDVTMVGSTEHVIRLLGLPTGEFNLSLAAERGEVTKTSITDGFRYGVSYRFSSVGTVGLVARIDQVRGGAWQNAVAIDQVNLSVIEWGIYLPNVAYPASQVSIAVSSDPRERNPITLTVQQVNRYIFQDGDQVIWTLPDGKEYNSTIGAANGEQDHPLQIEQWFLRGSKTIRVRIDRAVGSSWLTTATGEVTFTVAPN